jgi:hypothetical protein
MVFVTSWFGVTRATLSGAPARGSSDIEKIVENSLLMQANAAANQRRPLNRWPQVIISAKRRTAAAWRYGAFIDSRSRGYVCYGQRQNRAVTPRIGPCMVMLYS